LFLTKELKEFHLQVVPPAVLNQKIRQLGGNDAFIILEDADIDKTVEWAVVGRINNNGECCVASKRFIAVEAIADEFIEKFTAKLAQLKVGDPMGSKYRIRSFE
jgi:succinate-semialdehyde dehydrogenase/glutarate-semialdehyde dehydrogenase